MHKSKNKIIALLFSCSACISTFGQELQSPQISQNAIFANPGLAGSKGYTRISSTMAFVNQNYATRKQNTNDGYSYITNSYNQIYNGQITLDGLILKNKIGLAGYVKNESNQKKDLFNSYTSNPHVRVTSVPTDCYDYSNIYVGLMIAPKFYIYPKNPEKLICTLSPALGMGLKTTQFNFSSKDVYYYTSNGDTLKDGAHYKSNNLDYLSLGLLYSNSKSYIGIKFNFTQYKNYLSLYDISLVIAHSYFNKQSKNQNFSFNPQLYVTLPSYLLRNNSPYWRYFDDLNMHNLSSSICTNLDFRYKKILFGVFVNFTYKSFTNFTYYDDGAHVNYASINYSHGTYYGITGGVQLKNMRIIINYSPRISPETNTTNGLFLSANFYLKGKKERYK